MADLVLAQKDPATTLADALARYKAATVTPSNPDGTTLAPTDPRRLHLQAFLTLLAQQRPMIDYAGKQSLLRYVSDDAVDELAPLWGLTRLAALPSQTTERFSFTTSAARTVPAGARVTDGTNMWAVQTDTTQTGTYIDALVVCTVAGATTNELPPGSIATLVDADLLPGCTGVTNTTETVSGRDGEVLADFVTRLRGAPENTSTAGPRGAYENLALTGSSSAADVTILGPDDAGAMAGTAPTPGQVFALVIEGTRDDTGVVTSVVPDPGAGVLNDVTTALNSQTSRPMLDTVIVKAPNFVTFDGAVTYWIGNDQKDQAAAIETAAQAAFAAWLLWQQSSIGRDINPDQLRAGLMVAGVKRTDMGALVFQTLKRDESAKAGTVTLTFAGLEDE